MMSTTFVLYECLRGHKWHGFAGDVSDSCPKCGGSWDLGSKLALRTNPRHIRLLLKWLKLFIIKLLQDIKRKVYI